MGKAFSTDIRERLIGHIKSGRSRRSAAERFGVSPSAAIKLARREARTGSIAPAPMGRPRGGGKLAAHVERLIGWVEARPDITLPELAAQLADATGVVAHSTSIGRALRAAGFSYKKNAAGDGAWARGAPA